MKLYSYTGQEDFVPVSTLAEFLELSGNQWDVVSFVGGGGKTTSIYYLAEELTAAFLETRVLVTTTTKMHFPKKGCLLFSPSIRQVRQVFTGYSWITAGSNLGKKLGALPDQELEAMMETAGITLIEADGSKRLPSKAPASHEPVIPVRTTKVAAVAGLSCIGRPISQVCHRPELAAEVLGVDQEECMTPELLARLLWDTRGQKKMVSADQGFYVLLNQADDESRLKAARETAGFLWKMGCRHTAAVCFAPEERLEGYEPGSP